LLYRAQCLNSIEFSENEGYCVTGKRIIMSACLCDTVGFPF